MRLLDKPLSISEIRLERDTVDGNITRICVSDSAEEIISSLGFAVDRLSMIAYSRIKEISCKEELPNG